ncbi:hypothetical protein ACS6OF_06275 [Enterobacter hormaechei subsp. xiangfangensis]|uniref:hypothetical protein n=1 Tax=Enterobacter hormaechei TaxID=158836 RepID=UPI003F43759D
MTRSVFFSPKITKVVLRCVGYNLMPNVIFVNKNNNIMKNSMRILEALSFALGMWAFSAVSAEHSIGKRSAVCIDDTPECYAKTHHNPIRECIQVIDIKASFRHVWHADKGKPIFSNYLWHDKDKRTIQMFGQQAKAINSFGMPIPLQYFCVFNANTGAVIAASFE